jgi:hypothetical protein
LVCTILQDGSADVDQLKAELRRISALLSQVRRPTPWLSEHLLSKFLFNHLSLAREVKLFIKNSHCAVERTVNAVLKVLNAAQAETSDGRRTTGKEKRNTMGAASERLSNKCGSSDSAPLQTVDTLLVSLSSTSAAGNAAAEVQHHLLPNFNEAASQSLP